MNTEKLEIRDTGTAVANLAPQQAYAKLYKFLTDPEPPLALQTVVFMIAILVTCILIAIPA